jgi:hypothetical protein
MRAAAALDPRSAVGGPWQLHPPLLLTAPPEKSPSTARLRQAEKPKLASESVDHAEARFWSLQIPVALGHARRSTCIRSIAVEPGSSSIYNAKVSDAAMRDAFMWWENRADSRGAWNWRALPLRLGAVPPRCPAGEDGR